MKKFARATRLQWNKPIWTIACLIMIPAATLAQDSGQKNAELQNLLSNLQGQKNQIDASNRSQQKYNDWFRGENSKILRLRSTWQSSKDVLNLAEKSWYSKTNPTCSTGQTYAECSCSSGKTGKDRLQDIISRAKDYEASRRKELNNSVQNYNKNLDRYRSLNSQLSRQIQNYNQDIERANQMIRKPTESPQGAPDSFGEIEKRARLSK